MPVLMHFGIPQEEMVLRSVSRMTTIAEGRMNPKHLNGCVRQEHRTLIPWSVFVFTLGSESCPGKGEKG